MEKRTETVPVLYSVRRWLQLKKSLRLNNNTYKQLSILARSFAEEDQKQDGGHQDGEQALLQRAGSVATVVLAVLAVFDGYRAAGDLVGAGTWQGVPGDSAALTDRHRSWGTTVYKDKQNVSLRKLFCGRNYSK